MLLLHFACTKSVHVLCDMHCIKSARMWGTVWSMIMTMMVACLPATVFYVLTMYSREHCVCTRLHLADNCEYKCISKIQTQLRGGGVQTLGIVAPGHFLESCCGADVSSIWHVMLQQPFSRYLWSNGKNLSPEFWIWCFGCTSPKGEDLFRTDIYHCANFQADRCHLCWEKRATSIPFQSSILMYDG